MQDKINIRLYSLIEKLIYLLEESTKFSEIYNDQKLQNQITSRLYKICTLLLLLEKISKSGEQEFCVEKDKKIIEKFIKDYKYGI